MAEDPGIHVHVEAATGADGRPVPCRLRIADGRWEVAEVIDRWPDDDVLYSKVRTADGGVWILRHRRASGVWELVLYDAGDVELTRVSST